MNYKKDGPLLFLSRKSYSRYMEHLNRKRWDTEKIAEEKAHRKYLKEKSDEMADSWPDSIQNIKTREQERIEMKETLLEKIRTEQLQHYQKSQEEERKKFLSEARERIKMKRYPNSVLSSALMESQIRAENEAHLKLKRENQREEQEKEAKWVELIHESVQEYKRHEEEEKCKARQKSKIVQAFQLNQIEEKLKTNLNKQSERLMEEQNILKKMNEEIEERRENEIEDARKRKMDMKQYMRSHSLTKEKEKHILKAEEAESQAVCDIYNDFYKNRVCRIAKQRKQEINDFADAKRKLGFSNKRNDEDKEVKQNNIYLNQRIEQEKRFLQEMDQDTKRRKEMLKKLNTYYRDSRIKKQGEDNDRAEVFRYKVAERLKNSEEVKKYEEQKKMKSRESEVVFTKEWEKQIEEKNICNQNKASENAITDIHGIEDKKFFSYAKDVLEYVRSKGMDDYPTRREINKYCRNNQLPPFPKRLGIDKNPLLTSQSNELKLPKI